MTEKDREKMNRISESIAVLIEGNSHIVKQVDRTVEWCSNHMAHHWRLIYWVMGILSSIIIALVIALLTK